LARLRPSTPGLRLTLRVGRSKTPGLIGSLRVYDLQPLREGLPRLVQGLVAPTRPAISSRRSSERRGKLRAAAEVLRRRIKVAVDRNFCLFVKFVSQIPGTPAASCSFSKNSLRPCQVQKPLPNLKPKMTLNSLGSKGFHRQFSPNLKTSLLVEGQCDVRTCQFEHNHEKQPKPPMNLVTKDPETPSFTAPSSPIKANQATAKKYEASSPIAEAPARKGLLIWFVVLGIPCNTDLPIHSPHPPPSPRNPQKNLLPWTAFVQPALPESNQKAMNQHKIPIIPTPPPRNLTCEFLSSVVRPPKRSWRRRVLLTEEEGLWTQDCGLWLADSELPVFSPTQAVVNQRRSRKIVLNRVKNVPPCPCHSTASPLRAHPRLSAAIHGYPRPSTP
jgi:hypothetical protein